MAEWFEGGVPEAIVAAKKKGGVLIVYLAGALSVSRDLLPLPQPSEQHGFARRTWHTQMYVGHTPLASCLPSGNVSMDCDRPAAGMIL